MKKKLPRFLTIGFAAKHMVLSMTTLALIALATFGVLSPANQLEVSSATPAFSLNVSDFTVGTADSFDILLDGSGNTFYGAEGHLSYDSSKLQITSIDFGTCIFDSCADLSEAGTIKLLAASSPTGNTVTGARTFATVNVLPLSSGSLTLNFTTSDVIDGTKEVVAGGGTSGVVDILTEQGAICGNGGDPQAGEVCDDGDATDAGICNATCTGFTYCGDSTIQSPNGAAQAETCDDGNTISGDGCSNVCTTEVAICGDGNLDAGETCDDGNLLAGDGCSDTCQLEVAAVCGNGVPEVPEQCDDGNLLAGDGCNSSCQIEVPAVCGNGVVEGAEQCDDNNLVNGDGCSDVCQNEVAAVTLTGVTLATSAITKAPGNTEAFLQVGDQYQLIAFAQFSDGSSINVTSPNTNPGTSYSVINGPGSVPAPTSKYIAPAVGSATIRVMYDDGVVDVPPTSTIVINVAAASPPPICGNALIEGSEICDDGNTITESCTYGELNCVVCSDTCSQVAGSTSYCGDGVVDVDNGEACDGSADCDAGCQQIAPPLPADAPVNPEEELLPAAPNEAVIDAAVTEAETVVEDVPFQEESQLTVTVPNTSASDLCVQNYSVDVDNDGDGLSDRTECYIGTNPDNPNTDGDDCWDGDEINQFASDPLDGADCNVVVDATFDQVIITDPQPGWIVPANPSISGVVPLNATSVTVVAFHTDQKYIDKLIEGLTAYEQNSTNLDVLSNLDSAIAEVDEFILNNEADFDFKDLKAIVQNAKDLQSAIRQYDPEVGDFVYEGVFDTTANIKSLRSLKVDPIVMSVVPSDITAVGELSAQYFQVASAPLTDQKLFDIVVTAHFDDGGKLSSKPIRIGVDSDLAITKPIPRSIGGVALEKDKISLLDNIWIGDVKAQDLADGTEIEISDLRPKVRGDSEFGTQVFAIWNSIVLASSVIADSAEGSFVVQAPRNLQVDAGHKITLYAVKQTGDQKVRSESINVFFRIKSAPFQLKKVAYWLLGLLLIIIAIIVLRRTLKKRKAKEPDIGDVTAMYAGYDLNEAIEKQIEKEHKESVKGEVVPEAHKSAKHSANTFEPKESFWKRIFKSRHDVEVIPEAHKSAAASAHSFEKYSKKLDEEALPDAEEIAEHEADEMENES